MTLQWCLACEVAGDADACWACGGPVGPQRPAWVLGYQTLPAEVRAPGHRAAHPDAARVTP